MNPQAVNPGGDTREKLAICEVMRGPVPILNENGNASIDHLLNYEQRKEAADTIEALVEALEPLALLFGVNMNDPLHKWLTMANLQAANDALSRARANPEEKPNDL